MHRGSVPSRRWVVWLISVLMIGLVLPPTAVGLAQAAPLTLEEAVERAIRQDADRRAPDGIHVVPAIERTGWSFGTAVLRGTEDGHAPPDVVFYIATREGKTWQAAVESTAAYAQMLRQAPAGMIPDVFQPESGGVGAQAWENIQTLRLAMPFAPGTTLEFLGGPHGDNGPADERPWAAIDLGVPEGEGERVRAAASGFATSPCAIEDDGGPLVIIQHEKGWRTTYFHLTGNQPINRNVPRGAVLGSPSTESTGNGCFGSASGPHLHFALRRMEGGVEREINMHNVIIGGWKVIQGSAPYEGCIRKNILFGPGRIKRETVCRNSQFFNNGVIGTGPDILRVKPIPVVPGQKVELTVRKGMPEGQRLNLVYYWQMRGRSYSKLVKSYTSGSDSKDLYLSFRQPHWVQADSARLCIENQTLGLLACTTVRVKQ